MGPKRGAPREGAEHATSPEGVQATRDPVIFGGFPDFPWPSSGPLKGLAHPAEVWENAPMTAPEPPYPPSSGKRRGPRLTSDEAQARLADALRENLRRRKTQMRAREDAPDRASPDPEDKAKSE